MLLLESLSSSLWDTMIRSLVHHIRLGWNCFSGLFLVAYLRSTDVCWHLPRKGHRISLFPECHKSITFPVFESPEVRLRLQGVTRWQIRVGLYKEAKLWILHQHDFWRTDPALLIHLAYSWHTIFVWWMNILCRCKVVNKIHHTMCTQSTFSDSISPVNLLRTIL